jgi:hypothetical protein
MIPQVPNPRAEKAQKELERVEDERASLHEKWEDAERLCGAACEERDQAEQKLSEVTAERDKLRSEADGRNELLAHFRDERAALSGRLAEVSGGVESAQLASPQTEPQGWCPKCRKAVTPLLTDECPDCGSFQYTDDPASRRSAYGVAAESQGDVVEKVAKRFWSLRIFADNLPSWEELTDKERALKLDNARSFVAELTPLLTLEAKEWLEEAEALFRRRAGEWEDMREALSLDDDRRKTYERIALAHLRDANHLFEGLAALNKEDSDG